MQLISSKPISHQIFFICICGIAFFSIDAYADQYNHCTSTQKLGLAKDFRKGVLGWIATVKEEIKGEGAGFIDFAKNKAVIKSMNLLANKLNVNKDAFQKAFRGLVSRDAELKSSILCSHHVSNETLERTEVTPRARLRMERRDVQVGVRRQTEQEAKSASC